MSRPRLRHANLPTPLQPAERLSAALGVELWVKRDDATGGPEAGNKVRKLEYLVADALDRGCDRLVTCGGVQSNHARATAVLAAAYGLKATLFLRATTLDDDDEGRGVPATETHAPRQGNVLLDHLLGAELRLITAASYARRTELMEAAAARARDRGERPYVIAEGGSSPLGALGYVEAMAEVRAQLDAEQAGGRAFDRVVVACGSGGTAAGVALGARRYEVATRLTAMAVCDDAATFTRRIDELVQGCQALDEACGPACDWAVDDRARGPAYGVATAAQRERLRQVARLSGLVLDPVYTGKAFDGLWSLAEQGAVAGERVLFIHTGGLPGLLAQASAFAD